MSMLLDGAACYKDCNVSVEFQNRIASWGCIVIVLHKIKQPRKKKQNEIMKYSIICSTKPKQGIVLVPSSFDSIPLCYYKVISS